MPIDIGGGILHKEVQEIRVPGKYDLAWTRNYSTAILENAASPLGRGWTNAYFCRLVYGQGSYHFQGPEGGMESLFDPEQRVERGELIVNFGAFLDLHARRHSYVVRHWNVDNGEVTQYVFARMPPGTVCVLQAIELPTGQGLDLEYDARGRLIAISQRLERRRLVLGYGTGNLVQEVVFQPFPGEGYTRARYRHDRSGNLIAAADPAGFEDHYEYDAAGRMVREVVKDGGVFTMRYDRTGRCVYMSGQDRYDEKRLRFLDAAGFVEVTDSTSAVWRYKRLRTGQITEEINPLGGVKTTTYDDHGRIIAVTDEVGARTSFAYDAQGNRAGITNPLGHTFLLEYNAARLPVRLVDPAGGVSERRYDVQNQLVATRDAAGAVWSYTYDSAGNLVRVVNPAGAEMALSFSGGVLVQGTDWMGNVSRYRLDAFGRLVERIDPLGLVTRIGYDQWGNLVEHRAPDGSVRRAEFDPSGNMTRYVDANGAVTRFIHGPCGLLQGIVAPDGSATYHFWSTEPDRLVEIHNEKGEKYRFVRDPAGNVVEEIGFDGRRIRYRHDLAGRYVRVVNDSGEELVLERDALGRVVRRVLPDGSVTAFVFDALGAMAAASNQHIELQFERDPVGRLIREVQGEHWVRSTYDVAGHLVRTETDLGLVVEYTVDQNGDIRRVACGGDEIGVDRDARGLETARAFFDTGALHLQHDPVGRLSGQLLSLGADGTAPEHPMRTVALRRTYQYAVTGMLREFTDSGWGTRSYRYDLADRLIEVATPAGVLERFEYDPADNLVTIGAQGATPRVRELAYETGNRLRRADGVVFRFDPDGRLAAKGHDTPAGFRADWEFTWNAGDELVGLTRPDGESWSYAYDPMGRRIAKHREGRPDTVFVWDRDCLVHEVHGDSVVGWVTARESLAPFARIDERGVSAVVCDHLGTPIAFVHAGGGFERADRLSAWGVLEEPARPPGRTSLRFQGQYFDAESGLHYSRFRYYAPDLGRFVSQDPISLNGGFNLYRYAVNPTSFIDPYGLSTSSDSQILGNNLSGVGQTPIGSNNDAHHIVQSNSTDQRMVDLRTVMAGHSLDVNDPRNGIWLPRTSADRQPGDTRTLHKGEGLHGDAYKQHVYNRLMAGAPPPPSRQQFLARLSALKKELAQGKTFPCK